MNIKARAAKHLVLPDIGRRITSSLNRPLSKSLDRLRTVALIYFDADWHACSSVAYAPVADLIRREQFTFEKANFYLFRKELWLLIPSPPQSRDIGSVRK